MINESKKTFFFFAPEAGVYPHFASLCLLASFLKAQGHTVLMLQCHGLFKRCPVMDCAVMPYDIPQEQKKNFCDTCSNDSSVLLGHYGLEGVPLNQFLTAEIASRYEDALAQMPADVRGYHYDGVPMGKACISDLILGTKQYDFDNPQPWILDALRQYTASFLLSYLLIDHLLGSHRPDGLVSFNDYSVMLAGRMAARKHQLPHFTVTWANHRGVDFQNFIIADQTLRECIVQAIPRWEMWRDLVISPSQLKRGADDIIYRQSSSNIFVYSPNKTINQDSLIEKTNLKQGKKLVVAYTSSYDEVHAADALMSTLGYDGLPYEMLFADQLEWIEALTRYVEARDDLQLVVRIHPREAPNRRDSGTSQHLVQLRSRFDRPFRNCSIVWPESDTSSYDLAEMADLVLIGWSTMGLELARAGIPVLAMTRGIMYPGDSFVECATSVDDYFQKLARLLASPPDPERTLLAYRFYNYWVFCNSVNFADVIPTSNYTGPIICPPPAESPTIERVMAGGEPLCEINLQRLRQAQESNSAEEEHEALKVQLRRLLHFYCSREECEEDYHLVVSDNFEMREELKQRHPSSHLLVLSGKEVHYLWGDREVSRFSPMCARLGILAADLLLREEARGEEPGVKKGRRENSVSSPALPVEAVLEQAR